MLEPEIKVQLIKIAWEWATKQNLQQSVYANKSIFEVFKIAYEELIKAVTP